MMSREVIRSAKSFAHSGNPGSEAASRVWALLKSLVRSDGREHEVRLKSALSSRMRRALLGLLVAVAAAPWALAQSPRPAVLSRPIWFDRGGQRLGAVGPVADHGNLEISPDGSRVAVAVTDAALATRDIWIYNLGSGERTRFTSDPADENWLIWSPDGARVLLNSFARDRLSLLEAPSSGVSPRTPVLEGSEGKWPVSWSPDGRFVLYVTNDDRTSNDIWVLDAMAPARPILTFIPRHPRTGRHFPQTGNGWLSASLNPASPKSSWRRFRCPFAAGGSRPTAVRRHAGGGTARRFSTSRRTGC